MQKQAVEITTFKLLDCTFEEFVAANRTDIDGWLKKQKGFLSRYLVETAGNTVMDMVFWESVAQGTEAMHRIISETRGSKVHAMIDHGSVSWNIYPVGHLILQNRLKLE